MPSEPVRERGTLSGNHNRALEQFRMRGECG